MVDRVESDSPTTGKDGARKTWADLMNSNPRSTDSSSSDETRPSSERDISLEFIDEKNEEKFERLLEEDKIKTPFKRRYSNTSSMESRPTSPHEGNNSKQNNLTDDARKRGDRSQFNEKRFRRNSNTSSSSSSSSGIEADPIVLARRQKQIDYGKNTVAYDRYVAMIPRAERTREHPKTPNKYGKYSRRAFDGLIKIWRKQLHHFDPKIVENVEDSSSSSDEEEN